MSKNPSTRLLGPSFLAMSAAFFLAAAAAPALAQNATDEETAEATPPASSIAAWGITDAELQADPGITYGVLPNGMRYALKQNTQPKGAASMRLLFNVGTRDERDSEEGAAHFVEHMAFNGSTNIPEGELVPMLERMGLAFGADTNAETWPDHTVYKLDLPKLDDETLDVSFKILREMASELTIAPSAVEAEKGIILSEYQVRNTPDRRRGGEFFSDIMATSRLADRSVAEPEATRSLTAETLRGFYEGYYRPEKATLAIVGDFDIAAMEKRIAETFSSWKGKGEARDNFAPKLADLGDIKTSVFVDPAARDVIEFHRLADYSPPSNSVDEFREGMLDLAAVIAMGARFSSLSREEDSKFFSGGIGSQDLYQSLKMNLMVVNAKGGEWRGAVQAGEQQWRRMAEFGITNSELKQAKEAIASSLATAVAQSNSATSAGLASALAASSLGNAVSQTPEQRLALYNQIADSITPEAVQANFVAKWGRHPTYVQVASPTAIEGGADAVTAALTESAQVAVVAPEEAADIEFAYTDFGPEGKVVADERIESVGIRTIEFENGVRLNLKKTDFEPGKVLVRAEIGTGISTVTDKTGLFLLAAIANAGDDLGKHSSEDLRRLLSGRQVGYGYELDSGAVRIGNSTTADDLLFQLQIMAAQVTDTAFGAATQRRWEAAVPAIVNNVLSDPGARHAIALESIIANGDGRFGFADPTVLANLSMDDLKAVVGSQFASGRMDIGIVGDFDEDTAIAAVAQTLGAIERAGAGEKTVAPVSFTTDRSVRIIYHKGQADQGIISLSWPTDDGLEMRPSMVRMMLAEVIQLEALRVLREELGATYTPGTSSNASTTYDGFGYISLSMPATPDNMDVVSKTVRDLVAGFTETAPSEDTMQRARQPVLERYQRSDGTNGGWIGTVTDAQRYPERIDERRKRSEVLASITPEEVMAAAKEFLTAEPIEIRAIPEPAAPEEPAAE